jgi:hypothetical protein
MENNAASALYNLLVTKDFEPEALDSSGKAATDPAEAEMFSFDFRTPDSNYGTVVVLLGADNDLSVYFGDNLGRGMDRADRKFWYDFLAQLKSFATRNMLEFNLENLNRLKYTMQGMAAIREGLFEGYYGTRRVSYSDQPQRTRLMIRHNRDLGEGEARHRAIESIFIENESGERFRVPTRSLTHGRMLARHVAEGGTPYDAFGQHINEVVQEMATLSRFIRAARSKGFQGEAAGMIEAAVRHYTDLKAKAKNMISRRGYLEARDGFDPAGSRDVEHTVESIRSMFIEQSLDQRIEEALPILARMARDGAADDMREITEFEQWADSVLEDSDAALPQDRERLEQLMGKPLAVGPDALNATEALSGIFDDQELFAELQDLAAQDADADARPVILQYLRDTESMEEDLDTDGVMMTRPSNMSS